jgi:hypothetical protein
MDGRMNSKLRSMQERKGLTGFSLRASQSWPICHCLVQALRLEVFLVDFIKY